MTDSCRPPPLGTWRVWVWIQSGAMKHRVSVFYAISRAHSHGQVQEETRGIDLQGVNNAVMEEY